MDKNYLDVNFVLTFLHLSLVIENCMLSCKHFNESKCLAFTTSELVIYKCANLGFVESGPSLF